MNLAPLVLVCLGNIEYQGRIPNGGVTWSGAVGHVRADGVGGVDAFGVAFKEEGFRWTAALCSSDSDGDGYTNGEELGDPACTWKEGGVPQRLVGTSNPGRRDSTPVSVVGVALKPGPTPPRLRNAVTSAVKGEVQISFSSDSSCSRISSTVKLSDADAVCRAVTTTPSLTTAYGVAYCDTTGGAIYVQTPFSTLSDCVSAAGTIGLLTFSPATIKFSLATGIGSCVAYISNGVTSYVQLTSCTCSGAGTATSPSFSPVVSPPVVPGVVATPMPTAITTSPTPTPPSSDESVYTWMVVVLVVLVAALVIACVYMAVDRARHTSHLGTEDGVAPAPRGEEFDANDMHPDNALPRGPSARAMQELEQNPSVANPIGTAFSTYPPPPSTYK